MRYFEPYTLNVSGKLLEVDSPIVMGILNATPDSFYSGSRCDSDEAVRMRVRQIVSEGGRIIDVGGYSSRPMADDVAPEDEWRRLSAALRIVRDEAPGAIVSVDTFRASIAERCVGEYGVDIVNDISSGQLDRAMIPTVARLKVPYVMMHMRGNPHTMQDFTDYGDVAADVMRFLGDRMKEAAYAGISDIILDPGFGFSKTLDQNYELLARMELLRELGYPLLVGVSRKSMVYKLLGTSPEQSLNATTAVNTLALLKGASILRVHDVREAVEAVAVVEKFREESPC
ncbi:MAG: dihydropteroate synthase [Bacteroidetes bacterium]|uniref:dihydropteroate synthase n=1 Tax=Candidatus Limisoma faecipullorum TaxID=2840854 RepID=A0A9D9IQ42_9BACT|nr:dihydropteroate synthase [Candidatus Limisoma faecipullorum]